MKKSQIRDVLILAVVALILFSITILIETALHEFPLRSVIFGSSIFIVIVILLFSLFFLFHRSLFQEEMGTLITSYRSEVERLCESHKKEMGDLLASRRQEMNALIGSHREEVEALIQRLQSLIPPIQFDWLLGSALLVCCWAFHFF